MDNNTFINQLNSFYQELKQIVGEFDMDIHISENKENYDKFLSDIQEIFNVSNDQSNILSILKTRKQLGLLPNVNDNWSKDAIHTRYDHSIGVTAKCIVVCAYLNSKITDNTPKLTEQDIRELALAAALHDAGHLPISHAVERAFLSCQEDVAHEERIIRMLLGDNHPLFKDLFDKIRLWKIYEKDDSLLYDSLLRIAYLISNNETEKLVTRLKNHYKLKYPKRVLQQLLSSEIDMDRLDFILRDAEKLKYTPVILIRDKILHFIKGLSLKSTYCTNKNIDYNTELCIDSKYVQYIFTFLVSRVLMYKDCYFSEKVRGFEGLVTYVVSEFILHNLPPNSQELVEYSDEDFCTKYLKERVQFLPDNDNNPNDENSISTREHIKKQVQAINENKTNRYKLLYSIDLKNPHNEDDRALIPRLKDELEEDIYDYAYINDIKNRIIKSSGDKMFKRGEFFIDVFSIKKGEGNLLVNDEKEGMKLLKDYMNGSNIHRLYTKTRLDFYHKSDLSPARIKDIKEQIINFFYGTK